ncbi:hypothetical protein BU16DRAFT_560341 [Lophium mytilinum]|uniref:Uncharacterized protein n=1 Tax=Lophium mytilinum TaxID=390894 RepID=A0A6A6QX82_9PEZI|nr:hypothetical protein BU16DRAFT_560341 [Lophium mytilinum]
MASKEGAIRASDSSTKNCHNSPTLPLVANLPQKKLSLQSPKTTTESQTQPTTTMCKLLTQIYACRCRREICTTRCEIAQTTSVFCKQPFERSPPASYYPCKKCLGQPEWKGLRERMWRAYNESQYFPYRRPLEWVMNFQGVVVVVPKVVPEVVPLEEEVEEEMQERNEEGGEGPGELKVVN